MATTYDPTHPQYLDEADVRAELSRVFDVCHGCRRCVELCTVFPTLFDLIEGLDDGAGDAADAGGAGALTPAQQDDVVGRCFQCKLCAVDCPYAPGRHESEVDVPRLMLRTAAMRHVNGHVPLRDRLATQVMARTDLVGAAATAAAPVVNKVVGAPGGSWIRRVAAAATGVSPVRMLPPYARRRFSTWFRAWLAERGAGTDRPQRAVTVYPTCVVEYQEPEIGHDLVKVYDHNGIECRPTAAGCCGAPWLHAGDVARFRKVAATNVAVLADEIRDGTEVVVPQPTCSYVLTYDYLDHVGGPDAELVARHTHDAVDYLMQVHRTAARPDTGLDTGFSGEVPATITYHLPCHLRAQGVGVPGADLLRLTGAEVEVVDRCSGIDGMWGLRAGHEEIAVPMAAALGDRVTGCGGDVVAGDCHLANTAIAEQAGRTPLHPLQVVARAYGLASES